MERHNNHLFERNQERSSSDFAEKLASAWKRIHPEHFGKKIDEVIGKKNILHAKEEYIQDSDVVSLMQEYDIDFSEFKEVNGYYEIPAKEHFMEERLPNKYGYKGGAARELLNRALKVKLKSIPRDIDIVRFSSSEPEPGLDNQLAEKYMPNDFFHGATVEPIDDFEKYFETRDLTINEVLATDSVIWCTKQCLTDTLRIIIRVTKFEKTGWGGVPGPKMLSKSIRFMAEAVHKYGELATLQLDNWDYESYFISPFWLSLQLDRASEQGQDIAQNYVEALVSLDQLPKDVNTVELATDYLIGLMGEDSFYFRYAPVGQFDIEDNWIAIEEQFES